MNNNPIAIIDSGVGGLSCIDVIRDAMPEEDIIYFGDTANMPYGTKSAEEICAAQEKIAEYLLSRDVKMVILACNTLSAVVIPTYYRIMPMALVQDIIEPSVTATSRVCTTESRLGIIATPTTIESGVHKKAFDKLKKKFAIFYKGCPDLSVYIERGITEGPELEALLHEYMDGMVYEDKIDTLLLGCTHYPLAEDTIRKLYPDLKLVNPAESLARVASMMLNLHELNADEDRDGSLQICVSRRTEGFSSMAEKLGFGDIPVEEVVL